MSQDARLPSDLLGRRSECGELDLLLADVLAGRSRVVVLRGEAGVGKSALLDYLSGRPGGWQVARAAGRSPGRPAWNRRWNWPTPGCTSSARRCWTISAGVATTTFGLHSTALVYSAALAALVAVAAGILLAGPWPTGPGHFTGANGGLAHDDGDKATNGGQHGQYRGRQ